MKTKRNSINYLLWLALILALIGSLKHLAAIFTSVDGDALIGWLQAVAIDAGLFALAYSIRVRRSARRSVKPLWFGVTLFSIISIYGNYAYGLQATTGQLPWWIVQSKPVILAASLPVLVMFLSELLSDDNQYFQAEAEKESKRQAKKENPTPLADDVSALLEQAQEARRRNKKYAMDALVTYLKNNPLATYTEAGRAIGRKRSTVGNYIAELEQSGRITRNGNGFVVKEV